MIEKAKVKDREREQRMNPKGKEKGSEKEKDQRDGKHSVSNRGHNDDHNQVESYAYSSGSPERPKSEFLLYLLHLLSPPHLDNISFFLCYLLMKPAKVCTAGIEPTKVNTATVRTD